MILGQHKLISENKIRLIHEQDTLTTKNYKKNLKLNKKSKNTIKQKISKKQIAIDTCSGINLTPDLELIEDYVQLETTPSFYGVGEGNKINILGAGFLNIKISPTATIRTAVFYTPKEDATILSALKLNNDTGLQIDANFKFVYNKNYKINTRKYMNTLWANEEDIIGMPKPQKLRRIIPTNPIHSKETMDYIEAHQRLGHVSHSTIQSSVAKGIFNDVKKIVDQDHECEICTMGKITRHKHYKGSMNYYYENKKPGYSWSIDIFGPVPNRDSMTPKYMLVMVDNVSRFLMTSFHKKKDQHTISQQIIENINKIETQSGRKVKEIRSDRGTEFYNSMLKDMLNSKGIIQTFTTTQDHAANARAERMIRTISGDIRTLLTQTAMPLKMWHYAARAATDVRNSIFNKQIKTSPVKMLHKEKIKVLLRSFIPFGAPAIIWQPTSNKQKPTGEIARSLCKNPEGDGYLFYVPNKRNNKIIASNNYTLMDTRKVTNTMPDYDKYFNEVMHEKQGHFNTDEFNYEEIADALNQDSNKEDNHEQDYFEDLDKIEHIGNEEILTSENGAEESDTQSEHEFDNTPRTDHELDDNSDETQPMVINKSTEDNDTDDIIENYTDSELSDEVLSDEEYSTEKSSANEDNFEDTMEAVQESEPQINKNTRDNKMEDLLSNDQPEQIQNIELVVNDSNMDMEVNNLREDKIEDIHDTQLADKTNSFEMEIDNVEAEPEEKNDNQSQLKRDNEQDYRENEFQIEKRTDRNQGVLQLNNQQLATRNTDMENKQITIRNQKQDKDQLYNRKEHKTKRVLRSQIPLDWDRQVIKKTKEKLQKQNIKTLKKYLQNEDTKNMITTKEQGSPKMERNKKGLRNTDQITSKRNVKKFLEKKFTSLDKPHPKRSKSTAQKAIYSDRPKRIIRDQENMSSEEEIEEIPRQLQEDMKGSSIFINKKTGPIAQRLRNSAKWQKLRSDNGNEIDVRKIRSIYFKDAIKNNKDLHSRIKYQEAYNKEYNNLIEMKVIDPQIKLDKKDVDNDKIIPINTIFDVKRDGTYKARIVARGDRQGQETYGNIETSLLNMDSLRVFLILSLEKNLRLRTMDINHAFLYADLEEELYILHPKNYTSITPLKKSLYGLKQSPKNWTDTLRTFLNKHGYYDTAYSAGLFMSNDKTNMIAAYVDDTLIAAPSEEGIDEIIKMFEEEFTLKIVGNMIGNNLNTDILGMDLNYDMSKGTATLSLESYITRWEKELAGKLHKRRYNTPYPSKYNFNPLFDKIECGEQERLQTVENLQHIVGRLNYIRSRGRLDIEYATGKVARLTKYPDVNIVQWAERILNYLVQHKHVGITIKKDNNKNKKITVLTDASVGDEYDFKSRIGVHIWYGKNLLVSYSAQTTKACNSSPEAELYGIHSGTEQALILKNKLESITNKKIKLSVVTDCQPAIDWIKNPYVKDRKKSITLQLVRLKDEIDKNNIDVYKIRGENNVADEHTKIVTAKKFQNLIQILNGKLTPETLLPYMEKEKIYYIGNPDPK